MIIAYYDGPRVGEYDLPDGARLRRANVGGINVIENADKIIVGPCSDDPSDPQVYSTWKDLKEAYEASEEFEGEVVVEDSLDEYGEAAGKTQLEEVVGEKQASVLEEQGYGTLLAAEALSEEDLLDIDGIGEKTVEKLK